MHLRKLCFKNPCLSGKSLLLRSMCIVYWLACGQWSKHRAKWLMGSFSSIRLRLLPVAQALAKELIKLSVCCYHIRPNHQSSGAQIGLWSFRRFAEPDLIKQPNWNPSIWPHLLELIQTLTALYTCLFVSYLFLTKNKLHLLLKDDF